MWTVVIMRHLGEESTNQQKDSEIDDRLLFGDIGVSRGHER